jgi:glycosyltransferase involved in cell wall biosynthesis
MEAFIKSTGIAPEKVFRIPVGVDTDLFPPQTLESRKSAKKKLDIPQDATVIGSFVKDGDGWGEGLEPKYIKAPEVFIEIIKNLKKDIPNLWVVLSGPARGFVKKELEKLNIPYRHRYVKKYSEISELYDALDLYIITSREEGGPKAAFESMAKGIPLVTTRVGQCADVVVNGQNAMMNAIDDVRGLTVSCVQILNDKGLKETIITNGYKTAMENSIEKQLPLWKEYLDKLVTF